MGDKNPTPYEDDEYAEYLSIWNQLNGAAKDTLYALHYKGPLWDGHVPSKSGRDTLLSLDLAAKVIVKGDEGFQACTYKGRRVLRCGRPDRFESPRAIAQRLLSNAAREDPSRG